MQHRSKQVYRALVMISASRALVGATVLFHVQKYTSALCSRAATSTHGIVLHG